MSINVNKDIDILTLGCSKNLVDSERLMGELSALGFHCHHDPAQAQSPIAIINTCGFIGDAKEESINTILEFGERKNRVGCTKSEIGATYPLEKLYVMGCLSQRYANELEKEIPEVDGWYGKFDYDKIVEALRAELPAGSTTTSSRSTIKRQLTTPSHYAYVKVSEGCDRMCSYCAIPHITGRHHSRPMQEILDETEWLAHKGVKEIIVIAQDLSSYGLDIVHRHLLPELIDKMAQIQGIEWIRLHYAYPTDFPMELLDVMGKHANVCKYLDIALQHSTDHMLQMMKRHISSAEQDHLLQTIRERVPGICIRTTLMVGHPGETEQDFEQLCEWTKKMRFDRMGAFAYSDEEGTYANKHYKDDIPDQIKQNRLDKLMNIQQEISYKLLQDKIGHCIRVIIDSEDENYYVGRSEYDSPEVDCEILIPKKSKVLQIGNFYNVTITKAEEFDLYGEI